DKDGIVVNDDGDQVRPVAYDISDWKKHVFIDAGANYEKPLKWYFSQGKHTIRLQGYEPVAIQGLSLESPTSYTAYEQAFDSSQLRSSAKEPIVLQAEHMSWKNDQIGRASRRERGQIGGGIAAGKGERR